MIIPVGTLYVSIYGDVSCTKHTWDLVVVPVMECPYYLAIKHKDKSLHDKYVSIAKRRHPDWGEQGSNSYNALMKLTASILKNGYRPDLPDVPMRVWKGTRLLEDGHHRAAVMCALFGPEYKVDVVENDVVLEIGYPADHCLCGNPCST
jgi:hypothetical protein